MKLALRVNCVDKLTPVPEHINEMPTVDLVIGNVRIDAGAGKIIVTFYHLTECLFNGRWHWGGISPCISLDLPKERLFEVHLIREGNEAAQLSKLIAEVWAVSAEEATKHFSSFVSR